MQLVEKLDRLEHWRPAVFPAKKQFDEVELHLANIPQEVALFLGREDERTGWCRSRETACRTAASS